MPMRSRRRKPNQKGLNWRVNGKAKKKRKLSCADKSFNRKSNRTRAKGDKKPMELSQSSLS